MFTGLGQDLTDLLHKENTHIKIFLLGRLEILTAFKIFLLGRLKILIAFCSLTDLK